MSSPTIENRIALITGGAGGLGLATAVRLAREGHRIAVADLDSAIARDAASRLPGSGHLGLRIDVSDEASVAQAFQLVEEHLGPVAILGNFAGTLGSDESGRQPDLAHLSLELWNRTFAVNATGTFLCLREYARRRRKTPVDHGRVINVSSSGAQLGGYQARSAYCASKGAVLSLTKAASRELAPLRITVNAIAPGPIDTPMLKAARGPAKAATAGSGYNVMNLLPAGRIGQPEEIAAAAAYLASVEAAFVTGSTLDVNGGLRMQ